MLSQQVDDFAYANLAVRGKLIGQIVDDADRARDRAQARPHHVLGRRQRRHPPRLRSRTRSPSYFEDAVVRLSQDGATLVVFTGIDTNFTPVFRGIRGKVAIYNENIRAIADRYDCIVADQWALKEVQDMRFFDDDRLHYNPLGHHEVARMVLRALNVPNDLQPMQPDPLPEPHLARGARRRPGVGARRTSCRGCCGGCGTSPRATRSPRSARIRCRSRTLAPGEGCRGRAAASRSSLARSAAPRARRRSPRRR